MAVIADASPLRYLTVIGQTELLPTIFAEVWRLVQFWPSYRLQVRPKASVN